MKTASVILASAVAPPVPRLFRGRGHCAVPPPPSANRRAVRPTARVRARRPARPRRFGVARLQAAKQSGRRLAHPFAGRRDDRLAADGDAAGDGRLGGEVARRVTGQVYGRLTYDFAPHERAGDKQHDRNCRPGDGRRMVERLQERHRPRVLASPGIELGPERSAIVLIERR